MSFLPSLRSSCSSASCSASSSTSSAVTLSRRSIRHIPKQAKPPKFKQLLHPQGWIAPLPTGATFIYNPPPTVPTNKFTVTPLDPILSKTGKVLPTGWARVPGYGHLAPRLDRKEEGIENKAVEYVVPEEVKAEIRHLRATNPRAWTTSALGQKFSLPPHIITHIAQNKSHRKFQQEDLDLRRERMRMTDVLREDGRKVQKSFW